MTLRCLRTITATLLLAASAVQAQTYPNKPLRIVLPFAPAGPVDVVARLIQPKLQELFGQPVVVENRPGAGGNIGVQAVAKSPADGYTILITSSSIAVNPSLTPTAGYDADRDFVGIANIATQPNLLIVHPSINAKNIEELIRLARSSKLAYASPGSGTTPHLTAENLFRALAKVDVTAIHFRGAGPAAAAVLGNEPPIGSLAVTAAMPLVKSGKVRALAISSSQRHPTLPDVPTFVESGFPTIQDYTWVGMFVPAGTPNDIVERLNSAVNRIIRMPDVRERLEGLAFDAVGGTPREFADYVRAEVIRWAKVVKDTGAKLE